MQPLPLYKVVKMWFLPPGIFIVLLLLLALYAGYNAYCIGKKHKYEGVNQVKKPLRIVCSTSFFLAILIYCLSVNAIAQRMMHGLEHLYQRVDTKVDAIICISGDFELEREKATARLYNKYRTPILMSGYKYDIATKMASIGIPKNEITVDKAYNTKENMQFTLPVVVKKGFKKVYLVSSANHMARSIYIFKKAFKNYGIEVVPWITGYYTQNKYIAKELEWTPEIENLRLTTKVLHELLGIIIYEMCYNF